MGEAGGTDIWIMPTPPPRPELVLDQLLLNLGDNIGPFGEMQGLLYSLGRNHSLPLLISLSGFMGS